MGLFSFGVFSSEIFNLEEENFQSEINTEDFYPVYRELAVYLVDIDFCRT